VKEGRENLLGCMASSRSLSIFVGNGSSLTMVFIIICFHGCYCCRFNY